MSQQSKWRERLSKVTIDQWRKPMKPVTIRSDPLSVDFQINGCIQLSRTDNGQAIQLSQTEWAWVMKSAELFGWPHCPLVTDGNGGLSDRGTLDEV